MLVLLFVIGCLVADASAQSKANKKPDEADKHFALQPGEFPPENTSHHIGGELIAVDHVKRTGTLRPDRSDDQSRAYVDRPLPFSMLPYGSIWFRGAPASLKDIPLGTHLHGEFYFDAERSRDPKLKALVEPHRTLHPYFAWHWIIRLEDDFSRAIRTQRYWRVDEVSLDPSKLTLTEVGPNGDAPTAKPVTFVLHASTRVWKGRAIGTLGDIAAGQIVIANLTDCTRKGPGRVADLWLDAESRAVATAQQLETHRLHLKQRGFPGKVDTVDNDKGLVTVTLFDGFDPSLDLKTTFAPLISTNTGIPTVTATVADESLRSYDQVNVIKRGPVISTQAVAKPPGSSGFQVTFRPSDLLEGFRPSRFVRLFPDGWGVDDLPKEEELSR